MQDAASGQDMGQYDNVGHGDLGGDDAGGVEGDDWEDVEEHPEVVLQYLRDIDQGNST